MCCVKLCLSRYCGCEWHDLTPAARQMLCFRQKCLKCSYFGIDIPNMDVYADQQQTGFAGTSDLKLASGQN
jgi:hypothetical protein